MPTSNGSSLFGGGNGFQSSLKAGDKPKDGEASKNLFGGGEIGSSFGNSQANNKKEGAPSLFGTTASNGFGN